MFYVGLDVHTWQVTICVTGDVRPIGPSCFWTASSFPFAVNRDESLALWAKHKYAGKLLQADLAKAEIPYKDARGIV